jgi:cytochrome-b5 reductase
MSDNSMYGKFELLVKRYDGGAVSQWLYGLEMGAMVGFKHIKFNIKAQYPFEGKKTISSTPSPSPCHERAPAHACPLLWC